MNVTIKTAILFLFTIVLLSCARHDPALERERLARKKSQDGIKVAVVWPEFEANNDGFKPAIEMALEEINQKTVLGRQLNLLWKDDQSSINKGRIIAQELAENPEIVAVIGHKNSYISIPASAIYEFSGLLMISPTSTSPKLTEQGFKNIFRIIPNDEATGRIIADYANRQGYKRLVIFYVKNRYGLDLANAFEKRINELNLVIVDRNSYREANEAHFQNIIDIWKDLGFDAIFIAGSMPAAGAFIQQTRTNGIAVPILGGDGLDYDELCHLGAASEGVTVASSFDPRDPRPIVQEFTAAFREKYGAMPDAKAALGYDTLKLLAQAIETAGSPSPRAVAETLHQMSGWNGVTGIHTFDGNGDVVDKRIVIKQVRNGRFELIE